MYRIVVLVKQVPDTHNITANAMKEDGTVNRAALPAIFNPEDLNALEAALDIKDRFGAEVIAITMGPPAAADVLRECLYRGADKVILLTDKRFAGADTLATSYVLAETIKKLGKIDIVFAGRQAIDGDTAQVGPQTAEKLDIPQIGYMLELKSLKKDTIEIKRSIENGVEIVKCKLPVLITVTEQTNTPRFPSAKKIAIYKKAMTKSEITKIDPNQSYIDPSKYSEEYLRNKGLLIEEWGLDELKIDPSMCGFAGSPTKVYKIESVVLEAKETKEYEPTFEGVSKLIHELLEQHIIG